jgi:Caspase domain
MPFLRAFLAFAAAIVISVCPALADKRIALVVGNSKYVEVSPLPNPENDATAIASALKTAGFEVILGLDLDQRGFEGKVRDFSQLIADADVAAFFYAGHGLQVAGRNYLIPVDAHLENERDLDFNTVSFDLVLKQMELGRETKTSIVFLDACRNNPFVRNLARSMGTRSIGVSQGLAQVDTGVGTFIAYSTQPDNVALDGSGPNSPFTSALAKHMREPDRDLTSVMIEVRKDVLAATGGKQVPWDHSALTGEFYFQRSGGGNAEDAKSGGGDDDALQQRLHSLENEVKKKSDTEQTQNMVALAQKRERLHQLREANDADQQAIFDTQSESGSSNDPDKRRNLMFDIGKIQIRMVRRNSEQKKLREEISDLETKLGIPSENADSESK